MDIGAFFNTSFTLPLILPDGGLLIEGKGAEWERARARAYGCRAVAA